MYEYVKTIIYILCVGLVTPQDQYWTLGSDFQGLIDRTENVKEYLNEQKNRVENVINTGYENTRNLKETMTNIVETLQTTNSNDINMRSFDESGQGVANSRSFIASDDTNSRLENPEVVLSVPAIITRNGYTCETHTVVSQGYLLNIHRIPRAKTGGVVPVKTVLLQHGLFASSADWILNGPEKGLAYVLADAGYDVWMSNIRGNKYSREHAWLSTNSKPYWDFSWHDVALHDIPAVIDHILNIKGKDTKITYIGHSMGTTILFAMLTIRPEYNNILSAGFALAPVVFMTDLKSPIKSLAPMTSTIAYMEMLYGSYELIPKTSSLGQISSSCTTDNIDFMVCKSLIFYICGYDDKQFNKTILPMFLAHLGTGTSWKTALHFTQEIVSGGNFQKFDYGPYYNQKLYGSDTPPAYDLSKITLPITLFWAQNDLLSSEKDVRMLYERLPPTTEMYLVPDPDFNHLDYLWAIDAPTLLNNKVLDSLTKVYNIKHNLLSWYYTSL